MSTVIIGGGSLKHSVDLAETASLTTTPERVNASSAAISATNMMVPNMLQIGSSNSSRLSSGS